MGAIGGRSLVVLCVWVCVVGLAAAAAFDTIGVRILIPLGRIPFWIGPEISFTTGFGYARISFFLTPDGKTLGLGSADLRLVADPAAGETLVRLTAGLFYFDPTRAFPSLTVGGGVAYRQLVGESIAAGLSGEFLYPLAVPAPLFSVSGGARWP